MRRLAKSAGIALLVFLISGFVLVGAFSSCSSEGTDMSAKSSTKTNIPRIDASAPERVELATFAFG